MLSYFLWRIILKLRRREPTEVCQNCKQGNNNKGKFKHTWKRQGIKIGLDKDNNLIKIPNKGYWHIFCELKKKYYPWDYRKRCYCNKRRSMF